MAVPRNWGSFKRRGGSFSHARAVLGYIWIFEGPFSGFLFKESQGDVGPYKDYVKLYLDSSALLM